MWCAKIAGKRYFLPVFKFVPMVKFQAGLNYLPCGLTVQQQNRPWGSPLQSQSMPSKIYLSYSEAWIQWTSFQSQSCGTALANNWDNSLVGPHLAQCSASAPPWHDQEFGNFCAVIPLWLGAASERDPVGLFMAAHWNGHMLMPGSQLGQAQCCTGRWLVHSWARAGKWKQLWKATVDGFARPSQPQVQHISIRHKCHVIPQPWLMLPVCHIFTVVL